MRNEVKASEIQIGQWLIDGDGAQFAQVASTEIDEWAPGRLIVIVGYANERNRTEFIRFGVSEFVSVEVQS